MTISNKPVVGLALGSGSARGWAHIGIIQALEDLGIQPQVIAGTSVGALVGAVYAAGKLKEFSEWVRELSPREVFGLVDFSFSGGMVKGERLFGFFEETHLKEVNIESLSKRYVSVATEMVSGREVWITRGPVIHAARASCAIPGLLTPVKYRDQWMLDGGLVNPVPVSACRALGADVIIAVNLNAQLVGRHMSPAGREQMEQEVEDKAEKTFWTRMVQSLSSGADDRPGMFDVMASSVNILQDRLTRSRMAGDPPEITLVPKLADFALMDFHRADEAIAEGARLVKEHEELLCSWVGTTGESGGSEALLEASGSMKPAPESGNQGDQDARESG